MLLDESRIDDYTSASKLRDNSHIVDPDRSMNKMKELKDALSNTILTNFTTEKNLFFFLTVGECPHLITHTPLADHLSSKT